MVLVILRSVTLFLAVHVSTASLKVAIKEGPLVRESEELHMVGHAVYDDVTPGPMSMIVEGPLILESEAFHMVGHAVYDDDVPAATWADLLFPATRVGLQCSPERPRDACGQHLVCHKGLCMHCHSDRECGRNRFCQKEISGKNLCVKEHVHVWTEVTQDPYELLCSILIFVSSMLAAAAGLGGGGVFVPLLILFSGLSPSDAVPLSQVMILCGSLVNISVFVGQRHPEYPDQAKIDYECVVLFMPMLCAGVTLGVLINKLSPNWLIIALLLITLLIALWRSSLKALQQYRKEAAMVSAPESAANAEASLENFLWLTNTNFRPISAIILTWIAVLVASLHDLAVCSYEYAFYLAGLILAMCLTTYLVSIYVINIPVEHIGDPYDDPMAPAIMDTRRSHPWSPRTARTHRFMWHSSYGTLLYATISFCAGLVGGLLGLGGGIILGPILLELGLHTEAVQATTALFVFISSSLATIQYALLSVEVYIWHYTLWYASITTVATVIGQWACNSYIRKHGKYSLINFAMCAVIGFSALALGYVGSYQVYHDYEAGLQMGFSWERLCNSKGVGIVAVDSMLVPEDARIKPVSSEPWGE